MKKIIFLAFIAMMAVMSGEAQESLTTGVASERLTEQEVKERVQAFMAGHTTASRSKVTNRAGVPEQLHAVDIDAQTLYAFNVEGGGYVIASADERTPAVLGYSDKGSIDPDLMPENMKAWLQQYDRAISALAADGARKLKARRVQEADYEPVAPLLKTTWGQDEPFNLYCPEYQGQEEKYRGLRAATGCVATAMAQVLNYHQWPQESTTAIPAYELAGEQDTSYPSYYDALEPTTFDWDKMLPTYREYDYEARQLKAILGTQEEQEAVSKLMRYCGQAVKMVYSHEGSGALDYPIAVVLPRQFGYDRKCRWLERFYFSFQAWEDTIYNELKNLRPVIYSGEDYEGGHTFVCDGYDGNHYFHINWGWDGWYDGNFLLDILDYDPNDDAGGFDNWQSIIIGIQPPTGEQGEEIAYALYMREEGPLFSLDSNTFTLYFDYDSVDLPIALCQWALGTKDEDGTLTPILVDPNVVQLFVDFESGWRYKIEDDVTRAGTKLKLYPMYKMLDIEGDDWKMIAPDQVYILAEWDENGRCHTYREKFDGTISVALAPGYTTLRVGEPTMLRFTVVNNGGEFWETLSMIAQYGTVNISSKAFDMKVLGRAGETITIDMPYTPQDYGHLGFYYESNGFASGEAEGTFWVEKGQGDNALLGARMMSYETPSGELHVKKCHFQRNGEGLEIKRWLPSATWPVYAELDEANGIMRIQCRPFVMQRGSSDVYDGFLSGDAAGEDDAPLLLYYDEGGNITMDQPWYIIIFGAPEYSVQAFNTKFYFVNGEFSSVDPFYGQLSGPACVVQEGAVFKLVNFMEMFRVVQGTLMADGSFSIPYQFCGVESVESGSDRIWYLSGSEDENAPAELTGHYDATHLYFDGSLYLHAYEPNYETGEMEMSYSMVYDNFSIQLFDGTTLTVPGESTGISALPSDDKRVSENTMYDLQGRRVNPRTAGKGIYIQGRKIILK